MQELNTDDLKVLGLGPEANIEAVEKAYEIIARRNNSDVKEGLASPEDDAKMEESNAAYSRLLGKSVPTYGRDAVEKGKWYVGWNRTSMENFFYLFKLQFILGIVGIAVVGILGYSFLTKPVYQFSVAYWGPVSANNAGFTELIKKSDPTIQNVQYFAAPKTVYKDAQSMEVNGAVLTLRILDCVALDKASYRSFASEGYFISLDDLAKEAGIDLKTQSKYLLTSTAGSDKKPHLYGLQVANTKSLNTVFSDVDTILTIPSNTLNLEPGKKFMRIMMKIVADEMKLSKKP